MAIRYKITLTEEERGRLEELTRKGNVAASKFRFARALLLCDASGDRTPWKVAEVARALGVTPRTLEHLKQRFVEQGLDAALERKPKSRAPKITFDGEFDARITALACSEPPPGRSRWTIRLLAQKAVELRIARSVSTMTVQRALKKTGCSLT